MSSDWEQEYVTPGHGGVTGAIERAPAENETYYNLPIPVDGKVPLLGVPGVGWVRSPRLEWDGALTHAGTVKIRKFSDFTINFVETPALAVPVTATSLALGDYRAVFVAYLDCLTKCEALVSLPGATNVRLVSDPVELPPADPRAAILSQIAHLDAQIGGPFAIAVNSAAREAMVSRWAAALEKTGSRTTGFIGSNVLISDAEATMGLDRNPFEALAEIPYNPETTVLNHGVDPAWLPIRPGEHVKSSILPADDNLRVDGELGKIRLPRGSFDVLDEVRVGRGGAVRLVIPVSGGAVVELADVPVVDGRAVFDPPLLLCMMYWHAHPSLVILEHGEPYDDRDVVFGGRCVAGLVHAAMRDGRTIPATARLSDGRTVSYEGHLCHIVDPDAEPAAARTLAEILKPPPEGGGGAIVRTITFDDDGAMTESLWEAAPAPDE